LTVKPSYDSWATSITPLPPGGAHIGTIASVNASLWFAMLSVKPAAHGAEDRERRARGGAGRRVLERTR
jgi:hypothetical protein